MSILEVNVRRFLMMLDDTSNIYKQISLDLSIERFFNESEQRYSERLTYSAIGKWIITLFNDRDFEEDSIEQVSKTHVTLTAIEVLNSFIKIEPSLRRYFKKARDLVRHIEEIYLQIGSVINGEYCFKKQTKKAQIKIGHLSLSSDIDINIFKTYGLGQRVNSSDNDLDLGDFAYIKENAEMYTTNLINNLRFNSLDLNCKKVQIYNIDKNKREYFSKNLIHKYNYLVAKIDDGLTYEILKNDESGIYSAQLPNIYTKSCNTLIFKHEIWRVILGICAINKCNAKCIIKIFDKSHIIFRFCGFVLPSFEESLIKCMAWPVNDSLSCVEFVTNYEMKNSVVEILSRLSIQILEDRVYG